MIRMTVQNLTLHADALTLLEGIDLEARPGRVHLVVGPAGSGKTLLARTLAGLEPDATGELYLDGRDVIDIAPGLRRIAWIASDNTLWPGYSAGTNVEFGLTLRGVGRQDRRARVSEALGWFGSDSLKHRRAESLSLADARRVALARSLVVDPQLLLIDEPLSGLADDEAESLRDNIVRVQAEQRVTTIILTRHADPWWAAADRISLIDRGTILQSGSPEDVLMRPTNRNAASVFGACNVLEGVVEAVDPKGEALVRLPLGRVLGRTSATGTVSPQPGDEVDVLFRPESISLTGTSPAGSAQWNRVPVKVLRIMFDGKLRKVELEAPGEIALTAAITSAQAMAIRSEQSLTAMIPSDQVSIAVTRSATAGDRPGLVFGGPSG